jgi:NAD(P)H dehydrogenase (quinone)
MTDSTNPTIFVTGATGQLGGLVLESLLAQGFGGTLVGGVRSTGSEAAKRIEAKGVTLRVADYSRPETLEAALAGVDRLLLVSSSEIGQRVPQHRNVIEAARKAGVNFVAYTSLLRADSSPLGLAAEHLQTEEALKASGLAFAILRNGWYTENYAASIAPALAHGVFLGSAGEGRIASAARRDYAEAAAAVLTGEGHAGRVYELAGDESYTLAEFAAGIAEAAGKPVVYKDLPQAEFAAALVGAGLPQPFAELLADSDAGAAKGALDDTGRQLSRLIGHSTAPYRSTIRDTVAAL